MSRIDRREFSRYASLAFLSGVSVIVSACGGSSYSSPSNPTSPTPEPAGPGDDVGQVSANHGHRAVITAAELMVGGALQLDIRGDADHSHTVALSAQEVQDARAGATVAAQSTTTQTATLPAHAHTVTFNPGSSTPPSPGY
jgi:hypothetical protein